jgi:hypothetical protein
MPRKYRNVQERNDIKDEVIANMGQLVSDANEIGVKDFLDVLDEFVSAKNESKEFKGEFNVPHINVTIHYYFPARRIYRQIAKITRNDPPTTA